MCAVVAVGVHAVGGRRCVGYGRAPIERRMSWCFRVLFSFPFFLQASFWWLLEGVWPSWLLATVLLVLVPCRSCNIPLSRSRAAAWGGVGSAKFESAAWRWNFALKRWRRCLRMVLQLENDRKRGGGVAEVRASFWTVGGRELAASAACRRVVHGVYFEGCMCCYLCFVMKRSVWKSAGSF